MMVAVAAYEHDCDPLTDRPGPHPGISREVSRWSCPDCDATWEVAWRRTGDFGEATSGQARRITGPSRRWQRDARRAVRDAGTPSEPSPT